MKTLLFDAPAPRARTAEPRRARRGLFAAVAAVTLALTAFTAQCTPEAGQLYGKISQERTSRGLADLQPHDQLAAKAQQWAERMAAAGTLSHSTLSEGITVSWTRLAENVGRGPNADAVHAALMGSPSHRANILDPGFRHVGVGTAWRGDTLYVAQVFMQ